MKKKKAGHGRSETFFREGLCCEGIQLGRQRRYQKKRRKGQGEDSDHKKGDAAEGNCRKETAIEDDQDVVA